MAFKARGTALLDSSQVFGKELKARLHLLESGSQPLFPMQKMASIRRFHLLTLGWEVSLGTLGQRSKTRFLHLLIILIKFGKPSRAFFLSSRMFCTATSPPPGRI